ncbi:flagellar biosynthetic protein FliO [Salsuginibacillus kocurii]|uniref:flagellar biosynthetic protein FliO n=1 Tax=Salsuginibacillus kocurii TaxID=427078 RepID=UPI000360FE50|nr:flagellar biosynthetic protein FliO [Salsuginibacillus kocurii]
MFQLRKRITCFILILLLSLLGTPGAALAEEEDGSVDDMLNNEEAEESEEEEEEEGELPVGEQGDDTAPLADQSLVSSFFQMMIGLGIVVLIMYVLLKIIKSRSQAYRGKRTLQNVGGVPLGSNKSVQIVKVGDRLLVVGVGDSIQLLREIEDEAEIEQLLKEDEAPAPDLSKKALDWWRQQRAKNSPQASSQELEPLLKERLDDVNKSREDIKNVVRDQNR